ncbi:hypothetical protein ACQQ9V_00950 [Hornefia butyriciproducens]|uniref:hypothetical protein n=1 Tax=Hornefia butyriciproducens TaxID=2652293 RepID=UPI003CFCEB65
MAKSTLFRPFLASTSINSHNRFFVIFFRIFLLFFSDSDALTTFLAGPSHRQFNTLSNKWSSASCNDTPGNSAALSLAGEVAKDCEG